jgi:hypothetical protein
VGLDRGRSSVRGRNWNKKRGVSESVNTLSHYHITIGEYETACAADEVSTYEVSEGSWSQSLVRRVWKTQETRHKTLISRVIGINNSIPLRTVVAEPW